MTSLKFKSLKLYNFLHSNTLLHVFTCDPLPHNPAALSKIYLLILNLDIDYVEHQFYTVCIVSSLLTHSVQNKGRVFIVHSILHVKAFHLRNYHTT